MDWFDYVEAKIAEQEDRERSVDRTRLEGTSMAFSLGDDGTMDTVVYCDDCGQEERFNYDGDINMFYEGINMTPEKMEADYQAWVKGCCEEAAETHECRPSQ